MAKVKEKEKAKEPEKLYIPTPLTLCNDAEDIKMSWAQAIPHKAVSTILGPQGSGKSALAYRVAEYNHEKKGMGAVVFQPTKKLMRLLPRWFKPAHTIDAIPEHVTVIIDEAHAHFGARDTQSGDNKLMATLNGLARQRDQTMMYLSHMSRKLDPAELWDCKRWIFRKPTGAQLLFERPLMQPFTARALKAYETVSNPLKKAYILNLDDLTFGFVNVKLPKFWSEEISSAMANMMQEVKRAA